MKTKPNVSPEHLARLRAEDEQLRPQLAAEAADVRAERQASQHQIPSLNLPNRVKGFKYEWEIGAKLGEGGRGVVCTAVPVGNLASPQASQIPQGKFVFKTVRVDLYRSADEIFEFASRVHSSLIREFRTLERLSALPCVPRVRDVGVLPYSLRGRNHHSEETVPITFIIQEFVEGRQLDKYLQEKYSTGTGTFHGIASAKEWFTLAIRITEALLAIQQREIVHRDIWCKNILVGEGDSIYFIDFGEAYFRQELAVAAVSNRSDGYLAPEIKQGSRWPSRRADVYSLGGVLYYMATGSHPKLEDRDDDALKTHVYSDIETTNPQLLKENHGVVDTIARCLRWDHHKRIRDAEVLLEELRVFDTESARPSVENVLDRLQTLLNDRKSKMPELFRRFAAIDLQHLCNVIEGMQQGSMDINGGHEELASGLTQYLSVLGDGDEYLAVSTAEFWHAGNAGINGRVLTMNRLLVQRGVKIRRLFIITESELEGGSMFWTVVNSHKAKRSDLSPGLWQMRYRVVDDGRKQDAIDFFDHFGVWLRGSEAVRLLPVYTRESASRVLRALRLRKYDGDVKIVRRAFDDEWNRPGTVEIV